MERGADFLGFRECRLDGFSGHRQVDGWTASLSTAKTLLDARDTARWSVGQGFLLLRRLAKPSTSARFPLLEDLHLRNYT